MKSLLSMKRLPGILAVGLVALAVGAAGAPASASTGGATISALTKAQKKAKSKALKKCNKKKTAKQKKSCKKKVNKKYKKLATPKGKVYQVALGDNFYTPGEVNLKVNDSINWSWANTGGYEPHNVTLATGPSGVSRGDFTSTTTAVQSTKFKRTFTKAGAYDFVCSLHFEMTMKVNVSN